MLHNNEKKNITLDRGKSGARRGGTSQRTTTALEVGEGPVSRGGSRPRRGLLRRRRRELRGGGPVAGEYGQAALVLELGEAASCAADPAGSGEDGLVCAESGGDGHPGAGGRR